MAERVKDESPPISARMHLFHYFACLNVLFLCLKQITPLTACFLSLFFLTLHRQVLMEDNPDLVRLHLLFFRLWLILVVDHGQSKVLQPLL